MKIYILLFDEDVFMLSISDPDLIDDDDTKILSSFSKGKIVFQIKETLDKDISETKCKDFTTKVSKNFGHDLISPVMIPSTYNGNYNTKSIKKMIENFRTLESANVKDLDFGESGMTGVVITIK